MADIDALFKQLGGDSSDSSLGGDSFARSGLDDLQLGRYTQTNLNDSSHNNAHNRSRSASVASSVTHDDPSMSHRDIVMGGDGDDDFSQNSSNDTSTNSRELERRASNKETPELNEVRKLASTETRNVKVWRYAVLLVLALTTILASWSAFSMTSAEEESSLEAQLDIYNRIIELSVSTTLATFIEKAAATGEVVTAHALSNNDQPDSSWPYVSLPDFERYTAHLVDAHCILYSPIIDVRTNEYLSGWSSYSVQNPPSSVQGGLPIPFLYEIEENPDGVESITPVVPDADSRPAVPVWQVSPLPETATLFNFNLLSQPELAGLYDATVAAGQFVLSNSTVSSRLIELLVAGASPGTPHITMFFPVWDTKELEESSIMTGLVASVLGWDSVLDEILPDEVDMTAVIHSTCEQAFTYLLSGDEAQFVGNGDLHDRRFENYKSEFVLLGNSTYSDGTNACRYSVELYPTEKLWFAYNTSAPTILAIIIGTIFSFVVIAVLKYNQIVQRKNNLIMQAAARASAMVTSFFPSQFRDQLLESSGRTAYSGGKENLKTFLNENDITEQEVRTRIKSKPIADLFPDCTVMFADIVGFTAWSSVREPSQVFILLETIFRAFDSIASRRGVFKVETVGDTYVAVTGLPEPRADHATAMARFAMVCLDKVMELTVKLEKTLGPDTGDLRMRFGMHSGPVTAGILRGERSRFQLFGDTMNTASRMESTGAPGRIQVSLDTADIITSAGKGHWLVQRDDKVFAKGKGEMQTYWVESRTKGDLNSSMHGSVTSTFSGLSAHRTFGTSNTYTGDVTPAKLNVAKVNMLLSEKVTRLIDWNADILQGILREIVARREASPRNPQDELADAYKRDKGKSVIDEVQEIITLPSFDSVAVRNQRDPTSIELSEAVTAQLYDYVLTIAALYRDNPFHNFEHASHVVQSVTKLMSRIVTPSDLETEDLQSEAERQEQLAGALHRHTYGITSDPLTRFACVFSALIHDVDHSGVPNAQLIKENTKVAEIYKNKSVAEQNSVDIGLDLIMEDCYEELRDAIFPTESEMRRFRQLVVNSVMATDIVDKDLKELRNNRWGTAFSPDQIENTASVNRKATIVIEHLIQASDVSHTMQHWYIYTKWNERLFFEMSLSYAQGRAEKDPAESWYQGELGFFDFYIIPLAKKLKDCGVFGVSSDEYLNYAIKNRQEWEVKGRGVVSEMITKFKKGNK